MDGGSTPARLAALEDAAQIHRALGHSVRLQLLRVLADGQASVGDLAFAIGTSQPATSRHLAVLHAVRLVQRRRSGHQVPYAVTRDEVRALLSLTVRVAQPGSFSGADRRTD